MKKRLLGLLCAGLAACGGSGSTGSDGGSGSLDATMEARVASECFDQRQQQLGRPPIHPRAPQADALRQRER